MISTERKIILTTISSHAMCHIAENSFPAVALLVSREFFGLTDGYAKIGLAYFIATLAFGVAALPAGRLVDRWGPRKMLLLYLIGSGISMLLIGFSTSFWMMTATLTLLCLFAGMYHPSGATLIALGTTRHGEAMGWHGVGGNLGLALAPILAAGLAQIFGWRGAFIGLSLFPFALAVLVFLGRVDAQVRKNQVKNNNNPDHGLSVLLVPLVLLFMLGMFNGMAYRGLLTFLPTYFSQAVDLPFLAGYSVAKGGALTTAVLLIGIIGQFMGGRLADRMNKELLYLILFIVACPLMVMIGYLDNLALVLCVSCFTLVYFANQPVGNAILPRYTSPRVQGSIFGLWFFMNFGTGSIMSLIAGRIGEKMGLTRIFPALGLCLLGVVIMAAILLWRTTRPGFSPLGLDSSDTGG